MFKILICFSLISIIFGSAINLNKLNHVNTDILVVENIEEIKKHNNSLIELSPLQQTNNYGAIRYQFGGRKLGDALLTYKDNYDGQWSTPRNVTLLINYYPEGEFSLEITYIEIHVFQSSNITRAYITDGGIGQRQISFVVEAGSTFVFQYAFGIYGLYN